MSQELDLLRKIHFGSVTEDELLDIYYQNPDNYRIRLNLAMHPRFPEKFAIDIIARLFSADLLRVIKNRRTRPNIRKRAEQEFTYKYQRFPLGEKISYMKIAPYSLLNYFIEEKDKHILAVILDNTNCTEELVLKFINRNGPKPPSTKYYATPNGINAHRLPKLSPPTPKHPFE